MNSNQIVYRRVCSYNDNVARHNCTLAGFNSRCRSAFDLRCVRLSEYATAITHHCTRKTIEILKRVKLRLARKTQGYARIERFDRRARDFLNSSQSRAMGRSQLVVEQINCVRCGSE